MTSGKNKALTIRAFVGKMMSLLLNMLSGFVIDFLPRSIIFNFMAVLTIGNDFGAHENKICLSFHFPPSICHEVMGLDVMI